MAEIRKILAQLGASGSTLYTLYTVPANTQTLISSIFVCNTSGSQNVFNISAAPSGAADTGSQYIYYQVPIPANETFVSTVGITLYSSDLMRVSASASGLNFSIYGVEIN